MKFFIVLMTMFMFTVTAKEYKAVFDCSSKDFNYLQSRMSLIGKTAAMIQEKGAQTDFVLLIHSGCTAIVSVLPENLVDASEVGFITNIQSILKTLHTKYHLKIRLCKLALNNADMDKDEVLGFISLTSNSFIDAIDLQNSGYAMMSFK